MNGFVQDRKGAPAPDWATLAVHIQPAAYRGVHSGNFLCVLDIRKG